MYTCRWQYQLIFSILNISIFLDKKWHIGPYGERESRSPGRSLFLELHFGWPRNNAADHPLHPSEMFPYRMKGTWLNSIPRRHKFARWPHKNPFVTSLSKHSSYSRTQYQHIGPYLFDWLHVLRSSGKQGYNGFKETGSYKQSEAVLHAKTPIGPV